MVPHLVAGKQKEIVLIEHMEEVTGVFNSHITDFIKQECSYIAYEQEQ